MDVYIVPIFSIPVFVILGIYFFIKLVLGEYSPKVKKIIYSVGILILLTILFYWIHIWVVTAPLAFILLLISLFICEKKKDVIKIAWAITFMMFPILIIFCILNAVGWE
ncbi:MAG: hypothetical protein KOO69_07055, partial [Victivallales bacterium]|nr:hypothetical protein [Victivallales bacterium]